MESEINDFDEALRAPGELLEGLVPRQIDIEMLLEYPREVVERYLYEQEAYWTRLLTHAERNAMVDHVREISYALAWEMFSEDEASVMPQETRRSISLQSLLEYSSGIFQKLARIVALIDRSPNQHLTRERVFVDFSLTRKSGPGSINYLLSHPRSHRFERAAPGSEIAPALRQAFSSRTPSGEEASYLPSQISETRVEVNYNTYENRFVRLFLTTMHNDINTISNVAAAQGVEEVHQKADTLQRGITELLQYDFLKYSSPVRSVHRPVTSYKQPQYHQAYELWRHYRKIFDFDWGNPLFKLPMRRTWLLYEYWCFFEVIDLLRNLGFKLIKDRVSMFFEDAESKMTIELPKGQPSVLELLRDSDDALVTMIYSGETPDESFLNPADGVSHTIDPSIFMMFEGKAYIFDITFKQYSTHGSWHDEMDRLHGFRDAFASAGTQVQEAWCLYPGRTLDGDSEEAIPHSTDSMVQDRGEGGFQRLHPADQGSWLGLEQLLSRWFPDLSLGDELSPELSPELSEEGITLSQTLVGEPEPPGAVDTPASENAIDSWGTSAGDPGPFDQAAEPHFVADPQSFGQTAEPPVADTIYGQSQDAPLPQMAEEPEQAGPGLRVFQMEEEQTGTVQPTYTQEFVTDDGIMQEESEEEASDLGSEPESQDN